MDGEKLCHTLRGTVSCKGTFPDFYGAAQEIAIDKDSVREVDTLSLFYLSRGSSVLQDVLWVKLKGKKAVKVFCKINAEFLEKRNIVDNKAFPATNKIAHITLQR